MEGNTIYNFTTTKSHCQGENSFKCIIRGVFGGLFRFLDHVWSVGGMTLLGSGFFFGELPPELNIGPRGPMTTGVFLSLQNH